MPIEPKQLARLTSGPMATDLGAWLILGGARLVPRFVLPRKVSEVEPARERFRSLLATFVPLDLRPDGVLNDAQQNAAFPDSPLREIAVPTLLVHGSAGATVPHARTVAVAADIPGARLVKGEGGTHETVFVAPKALAAIAAFLLPEGPAPSPPRPTGMVVRY